MSTHPAPARPRCSPGCLQPLLLCTGTGLHPWAASCQMAPRCLFSAQVAEAGIVLVYSLSGRELALPLGVPVHSKWTWFTSTSANVLLCGCTSISRSDLGTVFCFPRVLLPARQCDSQGKLPRVCLSQKIRAVTLWKRFVPLPVPCSPYPSSSFAIQSYRYTCIPPVWKGGNSAVITKKTFEIKRCQLFLATVFRLQAKSAN